MHRWEYMAIVLPHDRVRQEKVAGDETAERAVTAKVARVVHSGVMGVLVAHDQGCA